MESPGFKLSTSINVVGSTDKSNVPAANVFSVSTLSLKYANVPPPTNARPTTADMRPMPSFFLIPMIIPPQIFDFILTPHRDGLLRCDGVTALSWLTSFYSSLAGAQREGSACPPVKE